MMMMTTKMKSLLKKISAMSTETNDVQPHLKPTTNLTPSSDSQQRMRRRRCRTTAPSTTATSKSSDGSQARDSATRQARARSSCVPRCTSPPSVQVSPRLQLDERRKKFQNGWTRQRSSWSIFRFLADQRRSPNQGLRSRGLVRIRGSCFSR